MTLVLDTSAALAWTIIDERDADAEALFERIVREGALVTGLWHLEIANALLKNKRRGRLDAEQVARALRGFEMLPITTDGETRARAWSETLDLAWRHSLTVYDASYLELALRLRLPLATRDKHLRHAAGERGVTVLG